MTIVGFGEGMWGPGAASFLPPSILRVKFDSLEFI
jgi:hypothetical protein